MCLSVLKLAPAEYVYAIRMRSVSKIEILLKNRCKKKKKMEIGHFTLSIFGGRTEDNARVLGKVPKTE